MDELHRGLCRKLLLTKCVPVTAVNLSDFGELAWQDQLHEEMGCVQ
jgi:hypothetical protein